MNSYVGTDLWRIEIAKSKGVDMAFRAMRASKETHVPYSIICAFLMQETGGGQNIYGHDGGPGYWYYGAGTVTKANYAKYKAGRAAHGMQGVGPMQLTWYAFQDRADAAGGCWNAYVNLLTGVEIIKELHDQYDTADSGWYLAAYHYNGSKAYADQMKTRFSFWYNLFNPK